MRSPQRDTTAARQSSSPAAEPVLRGSVRRGEALLGLQRRYGNRRARGIIQAKLNVGAADDRYEREADRVSRLATGSTVQRAPEPIRHVHGAAGGVADPAVAGAVARARGSGRSVPDGVRERMERVSGADFGAVRLHVNAEADQLNDALGSRAFTVGADVFVRRGEYRPGTAQGDALLSHELTHTIQQGAAGPQAAGAVTTPAVTAPTAQRLFGFEFEMDVPVFSRTKGKDNKIVESPPAKIPAPKGKVETRADKARRTTIAEATDKSFHVNTDTRGSLKKAVPKSIHSKNSVPIIELVTRPMNEFTESEAQVAGVMQKLVAAANHINAHALQPNRSIPLDGIPGLTANPAGVNFVGHRVANEHKGLFSVNAYVQQTYGVSLRRIAGAGREFDARSKQTESTLPDRFKMALSMASLVGEKMVEHIRKDARFSPREEQDEAALDEASGLFALIENYLEVGKLDDPATLLKNKLGLFFYKTKLSTVRNDIVGSSPLLRGYLDDTETRNDLIVHLQEITGMDLLQPVFTNKIRQADGKVGNFPSRMAWINSVLRGDDDVVFEHAANAFSQELFAPDVGRDGGRGHGVVLENRAFGETQGSVLEHRYPPNEWPGLATDLRLYLRALQGD